MKGASLLVLVTLLAALPGSAQTTEPAQPPPSEPRLRWMERVELGDEVLEAGDPSGLTARAVLDLDARGWPAAWLRQAAGEGRNLLPRQLFHPLHGLFVLAGEELTSRQGGQRPVTWHGEGEYLGLLTVVGDRARLAAPFWLPREWLRALAPGDAPVELHGARRFELRQVITFVLPPGMPRLQLPPPAEGRGGGLVWRLGWRWEGGGRRHLEASFEAMLQPGALAGGELAAFRQELRRLWVALSRGASYSLEPTPAGGRIPPR